MKILLMSSIKAKVFSHCGNALYSPLNKIILLFFSSVDTFGADKERKWIHFHRNWSCQDSSSIVVNDKNKILKQNSENHDRIL